MERKGTVPEQAQWGYCSAGVGTRTDAGRWWVWWWHDARPLLLLPTGGQLGMGLKVSGKKGVTPWKWGWGAATGQRAGERGYRGGEGERPHGLRRGEV